MYLRLFGFALEGVGGSLFLGALPWLGPLICVSLWSLTWVVLV